MNEQEYFHNQHLCQAVLVATGHKSSHEYDLLLDKEFEEGKLLRIYSCKGWARKKLLHLFEISVPYTSARVQLLKKNGSVIDLDASQLHASQS